MVAWVYVPPRPQGPLPVALFLHGTPGAPDDWLAGGQLASSLDRAIAGGLFPPALAVVPDGEGMHDPRAGWADIPRQHLLTSVSRDLLSAVGRRWAADLGAGRMAVVGVGRGAAGGARLSWHDRRIGFVAALDPATRPRVRPGVRLLEVGSDARGHPRRNRWGEWRAELPGVLGWLGSQGFGASDSSGR
jgi:enterochelin esterase-like enzyme